MDKKPCRRIRRRDRRPKPLLRGSGRAGSESGGDCRKRARTSRERPSFL